MGRTTEWLVNARPAMVEILCEIERSSPYTATASHGDLSMLLACLARVAAGTGGRPRSIEAMRQAWWRWTTDGPHSGTPPVKDLALIVRYACDNQWLRNLRRADCVALMERLAQSLEERRASERRTLEVAWGPTARMAVEGLSDFLENRIAKRADEEGEGYWDASYPAGSVVQEEVRTMLTEVVERMLISLAVPREVFKSPLESDCLIQPGWGWPGAFRQLAAEMSNILNGAADEYEKLEEALLAPHRQARHNGPRRARLFRRLPDEPNRDEGK